MSKTTEQEWMLTSGSGQKIVRVEIIDNGHGIKYYTVSELNSENVQPQAGSKEFEEMFPIVDIENISLQDDFMQYNPKNNRGKRVKKSIIKAKVIGMKNFRKPVMDPSFADDGETIIYCAGEKPAVGKSANWWTENAPKFMPEKNSRIIDDLQKDVWLGILIKELVDKGYKVKEAWEAVSVASTDLGHYRNSKNPKNGFERTGSRPIGKWFDLGNTCKIVKKSEASGFVLFGGSYLYYSHHSPLADACSIDFLCDGCKDSVGELVLDV